MQSKERKLMFEYATMAFGAFILAIGINVFLEPMQLTTGGATGLGIVIQNVAKQQFNLSIPLWFTNLAINTPLFLIGIKTKGIGFLTKTIFATLLLSFFLFVTSFLPAMGTDLLLAAVFGGTLCGIGVGLVFRNMATTGGSDLAATLIHHYKKHWAVARIMFVIDAIVICIGFFVFGPTKVMYAIIAVFISSKMISNILEGLSFAKAAFIISEHHEEVAKQLLLNLNRGTTALFGKGMYTGTSKNVLLCVVSTKEVVKLKELVHEADKQAFVIVSDVREVLGEGFQTGI